MKTAYDLLISAPDEQITRCRIVYKAIAAGEWHDAAFTLSAAARETGGAWGAEAVALASFCRSCAAGGAQEIEISEGNHQ